MYAISLNRVYPFRDSSFFVITFDCLRSSLTDPPFYILQRRTVKSFPEEKHQLTIRRFPIWKMNYPLLTYQFKSIKCPSIKKPMYDSMG